MASLAAALGQIKWRLDEHLSNQQIHQACADANHQWRQRVLDPTTTLRLFVLQILHGNVACRALRHLDAMSASAAAYCKARKRLPLDVFGALVASVCMSMCQVSADVGK